METQVEYEVTTADRVAVLPDEGSDHRFENAAVMLAEMCGVALDDAQRAVAGLVELGKRLQQAGRSQVEVDALEAEPRCCGWEYMRDDGTMYAHHSIRDECPYPGHEADPKADRGLRAYVGRVEEKQEAVRQAMARYRDWEEAKKQLQEAERSVRIIRGQIRAVGGRQSRFRGW